jgi:hypothetical protein
VQKNTHLQRFAQKYGLMIKQFAVGRLQLVKSASTFCFLKEQPRLFLPTANCQLSSIGIKV